MDSLRGGKFFVTTGEVLIPEFTVNGRRSGEVVPGNKGSKAQVELELKWTFPLACAVIITGDGRDDIVAFSDEEQVALFNDTVATPFASAWAVFDTDTYTSDGSPVAGGDVNGDGAADLLLGRPYASDAGAPNPLIS